MGSFIKEQLHLRHLVHTNLFKFDCETSIFAYVNNVSGTNQY